MAMRKSTRSELAKLREVCGFLLQATRCRFCGDYLLDDETRTRMRALEGTGRGVPVDPKALSIHHHIDYRRKLVTAEIAHYTCHMRHEAKSRKRNGNKFVK